MQTTLFQLFHFVVWDTRLPRISSKYLFHLLCEKRLVHTVYLSSSTMAKKEEENLQTPKSKTRVVEDNQTRHAHRIPIAFCTDCYFHWALLYVNTPFFQVLMHECGCLTTL